MAITSMEENGVAIEEPDPLATSPSSRLMEELGGLVNRAKSGDITVLSELRRFLGSHRQLWHLTSVLAQRATEAQLHLICGDDASARETLVERLTVLKAELAGTAPTMLESLLIDRILACRLQVLHADLIYAHSNSGDPGQAKFHEQRLDRAHRRFGFAVKQLALVRKLLPSA